MQIGERLTFIEHFDPFVDRKAPDDTQIEKVFASFVNLCDDLLRLYPKNVKSIQQLFDGEFIKISESPLQLQSDDGSYLHVLPFSESCRGEISDFGLVVILHDEQGISRDGYAYRLDQESGVIRTRILSDSGFDGDDDGLHEHFSVISHREYEENLNELRLSDNIEDRMLAEERHAAINEIIAFDELQKDFGGSKVPSLDEILALRELILAATPYAEA